MTAAPTLFRRLIARPLLSEPVRTVLTVFAVALGVAVVVAIDLASDAAAGSFRSSMETLTGDAALEITAAGGLDEKYLGALVALPYPLRFVPRIEAFARMEPSRRSVPLFGLDLVGSAPDSAMRAFIPAGGPSLGDSIWASESLKLKPGTQLAITVNDSLLTYTVRGAIPGRDHFLVLDIGAAQLAAGRQGRIDRISVHTPPDAKQDWGAILRPALPPATEIGPTGSSTDSNRKMLTAFRWNLRILSYISLVVGAFLIYNTIAVSVVRRRAEIGVLRALGMTRIQVMSLFLGEAAAFGIVGAVLGLLLGRLMAEGAVGLLAATVQSLYVSSAPGDIAVSTATWAEAFVTGLGVSLLAAFAPSREAARVAPVEAMARGRRDHEITLHAARDLWLAFAVAALAAWAATRPALSGKPVFGYAACFLLIFAAALAMPALVGSVSRILAVVTRRTLGVEAALAARSVAASLSRTAILTGALSTAVAMMVAVGIMVGSFRETVTDWMTEQLRADLYLRPAAAGGAGKFPVLSPALADSIATLPGVEAVDRFRVYEIRYRGMPALLGGGQTAIVARYGRSRFLEGNRDEIWARLPQGDFCIVSEPFSNKHDVHAGDTISLPLAGRSVALHVMGVYADYSNERGYVIVDRATLLRYLPDPAPSSLAVYVAPGQDPARVRERIEQAIAGARVFVAPNRDLRTEAIRIFDRTFAITWALEAVAIFVAVLGVAGALLAMVIDRRRELGLLRFLGASASQIRRLILCEAGVLGLLANLAGFTLGSLLSLILIYVINKQSFGWTIQFHWPVMLLLAALTTIYTATVLAGLWPARAAVRLNPIEVIHEE